MPAYSFTGWRHFSVTTLAAPTCDFCLFRPPFKMAIDFKDAEQVKEYLENLGIEYRFGCFSEKNPEVCHLLGEYLDVVKNDYHKAAKIYKSNCDDENFGRSCHAYGHYLSTGRGVDKKNEDAAIEYFNKGCSLGISSSCYNAAVLLLNGSSKRERDYTRGLDLLEKSCNLNNAHACYYLSGLFVAGSGDKEGSVKKDMKRAFEYSQKACNLDHMYACRNLSLMYKRGDGCEKNEEMASKIDKKVQDLEQQLRQMAIEFQREKDPI